MNYLDWLYLLVALSVDIVLVKSEASHLVVKKQEYVWLKISNVGKVLGVSSIGPAVVVVFLTHEVNLLIVY